jgi:hypothetical protein
MIAFSKSSYYVPCLQWGNVTFGDVLRACLTWPALREWYTCRSTLPLKEKVKRPPFFSVRMSLRRAVSLELCNNGSRCAAHAKGVCGGWIHHKVHWRATSRLYLSVRCSKHCVLLATHTSLTFTHLMALCGRVHVPKHVVVHWMDGWLMCQTLVQRPDPQPSGGC